MGRLKHIFASFIFKRFLTSLRYRLVLISYAISLQQHNLVFSLQAISQTTNDIMMLLLSVFLTATLVSGSQQCPDGHELQQLLTPIDFRCAVCEKGQATNLEMWWCRECDWDMCFECYVAALPQCEKHLSEEEEMRQALEQSTLRAREEEQLREAQRQSALEAVEQHVQQPAPKAEHDVPLELIDGLNRRGLLGALEMLSPKTLATFA